MKTLALNLNGNLTSNNIPSTDPMLMWPADPSDDGVGTIMIDGGSLEFSMSLERLGSPLSSDERRVLFG
ncbi:hypothetical protein V6N12_056948 [Hibiscus sabdariffa]|uniref:Uncharacterized protein n=1 Tax=Hibiscus sabdariffa TaxID=183260 RepID=A0ABR2DCJ2_9ROSI